MSNYIILRCSVCYAQYEIARCPNGRHWYGPSAQESKIDFCDWLYEHSHIPENLPDTERFERGLRCFEFFYHRTPEPYPSDLEKIADSLESWNTLKLKLNLDK